jgi:hypothetical protein
MNLKLLKHVKAEGFCCMWAFLDAKRAVYTLNLLKEILTAGHVKSITDRALRHQRAAYRDGEIKCEKKDCCLKDKIKAARSSS